MAKPDPGASDEVLTLPGETATPTPPAELPADDAAEMVETWDTINTGLGKEWDFEKAGSLTGIYLGSQEVITDDPLNPGEKRNSTAYQFEPIGSRDVVFLWGSAELDKAMEDERIEVGRKLRVTFLGRETFTGQRGPQQIKRYRVDIARII